MVDAWKVVLAPYLVLRLSSQLILPCAAIVRTHTHLLMHTRQNLQLFRAGLASPATQHGVLHS